MVLCGPLWATFYRAGAVDPSMSEIFLIRTPVREVAGMVYGGPIRLRLGAQAAYAGFRTATLAAEVAEFWGVEGEHLIEPWTEALHHEVSGARVRRVLVFESRADFDLYLVQGEDFDFAPRTVELHPVMVGLQDRGERSSEPAQTPG